MEDILGNRFISVLGLSLCVIGLSACESISHVWDGKTSTEVSMREDNGNVMAPLTPELRQGNEPILPQAPVGYQLQGGIEVGGLNAMPPMMNSNDPLMANMNISGDSSVTIFPLDGVAPTMSLGGPSTSMVVNGSEFYNPSYAPVATPTYVGGGTPNTQIFFKHGSSRLGSGDMRKLSDVAQSATMSSGRIAVEGHASRPAQTSDPVRGSILNLKESMNRAYAVSKTLIQKGVPASKLKTTAYGDTVPAGSDQQQRRVDIISGGY
tara:strand:+ start:428 stop:1222 length:795 start_codon:yes stop_codon:yes gene_type:complete